MKLFVILLATVILAWVSAEDHENAKADFNHPKNLGWKSPEGHREKRYGGWGGGWGGQPWGGYGGYGGGFGGGYGGGYNNYGSSSWGSYSMSRSGGFSNYNSGGYGWGR